MKTQSYAGKFVERLKILCVCVCVCIEHEGSQFEQIL
jgi:hypothetical protein